MFRQQDRVDDDIAHPVETREALDALVEANSRRRAGLCPGLKPVACSTWC
ncbi:hypothetical protein [Streptomyces solincola]|nr:hypothetical protein [Streptomyces solincola]